MWDYKKEEKQGECMQEIMMYEEWRGAREREKKRQVQIENNEE